MGQRGPQATVSVWYESDRQRYRGRVNGKPKVILSGVPDTEDNYQEAVRRWKRSQLPVAAKDIVLVGELLDAFCARKKYTPGHCIHTYLQTVRRLRVRTTPGRKPQVLSLVPLDQLDEDVLVNVKTALQSTNHKGYQHKTARPYSLVTIKKYVKHFRQALDWGVKKGYVAKPEDGWTKPGLPAHEPLPKVPHLDKLQAALERLRHPQLTQRRCENCGEYLPALGFHLHQRACTGPGYRPKVARSTEPRDVKPAPCYTLCECAVNASTRPDELCGLEFDQVDWITGIATLAVEDHKTGEKTGESRTVYFTTRGWEILLQKRAERRPGQVHVFLNELGRRFKPSGVRSALRRVGLSGMYALRHAFATYALAQGTPLPVIQRWLGHKDPKTTAGYAKVLDPQALAAIRSLVSPLQLAAGTQDQPPAGLASVAVEPRTQTPRTSPGGSNSGRVSRRRCG